MKLMKVIFSCGKKKVLLVFVNLIKKDGLLFPSLSFSPGERIITLSSVRKLQFMLACTNRLYNNNN